MHHLLSAPLRSALHRTALHRPAPHRPRPLLGNGRCVPSVLSVAFRRASGRGGACRHLLSAPRTWTQVRDAVGPGWRRCGADDTGNRLRFQLELEFVQCLANPNYLNFLAQRGYFKDKAFVNYLKYLLYWKEPEYAKYLKYPQCLHMLELLQYEHFRKELVNAQCAKFIDEQQILHWQHYSRKRMRLQQALAEQQQQNNTSVK
ncbi:mediator of RNA polymerase II transcription subunit 31 isoform X1 [Aphelocoma coerulescens]|uniref:mediator of RNA polymerase II transcription subunit 31 isoform X1 n=1 Tax=Aphelocoma coerulescens TaxID=39617 RepID=UPI003604DA28